MGSPEVPARRRARPALVALLLAVALAAGACGGSDTARVEGPGADPALAPSDVACDEAVAGDDAVELTAAHLVVDGVLGALCAGEPDDTLVEAWGELVAISPPGQLSDLAVFAGFRADDEGDGETLAFVNALDAEGLAFQMSINLPAFTDDRDEASLTMAHEFSHVFTQTPSQLDWSSLGPQDCPTYFNGDGCYLAGSLMAAWIDRFWPGEELATVDVTAELFPTDGDERCAVDDSFLGAYAATSPEEDFAEAFSAFVYRVEPATAGQATKHDWIAARPGLAEFRRRAAEAGLGPLANRFELCGP